MTDHIKQSRQMLAPEELKLIGKALDRMAEILQEPAVIEQAGLAYYGREAESIEKAVAALEKIVPSPSTHAEKALNAKHLDEAMAGVDLADRMLGRNGFVDVKGIAWVERDKRIIDHAYAVVENQRNGASR